jgi:hypothetical protein
VQESAGDGDVAVDPGEEVGRGGDRLGNRERVLQQAVAVGLVVGLRRGGDLEAFPGLRVLAEEVVEQNPQLRVLNGRQQLAQVALEQVRRDL